VPIRVFLDASTLAKRYVVETGSPVVNYLFQRVRPTEMMCLTLGALEVISVFLRKRNARRIPLTAYNQALADFQNEVLGAPDFTKVPATDQVVYAAVSLLQKHSINANDAVVLQAALDLAVPLRTAGSDLLLVTSDKRLLRAARAEGLLTFDPETQSQADLDALLGP
jgi:predicted nucleic acid-binding protein